MSRTPSPASPTAFWRTWRARCWKPFRAASDRACRRASSATRCGPISAPMRRACTPCPKLPGKARLIGNPVRADISAVPPPAQRFAGRSGPVRILVIGGSQGATRLNAVVPFALKRVAGSLVFDVRHQAGERWVDAGRASYAQAGVRADVRPFIEDMGEAYGWADLVI